MPQVCTVCTHPQSNQINLAILRGEGSKRGIASRFGLDDEAVYRHRDNHLTELAKAQAEAKKFNAIDIGAELESCFHFAKKLRAACDDWLTDPEQKDAYTLDPRDTDVTVIYKEKVGEKEDGSPIWERKKAKLSRLLRHVEDESIVVDRGEVKTADPRKLILEALDRFDKHLRMFGDLTGAFVAPATNPADVVIQREQMTILASLLCTVYAQQKQLNQAQSAIEMLGSLLDAGPEALTAALVAAQG